MTTHPPRAGRRQRLLLPAALVLTPATVLVPIALLALRGHPSEASLVAAAGSAVAGADLSGPVAGSPALADLVALWGWFHLAKAVLAGLLVVTLVGVASGMRHRAVAAGPAERRWPARVAEAGVLGWLLLALTVLLANVQGAVAPLASVASLLPPGRGAGELGAVVDDLRRSVSAQPLSPASGLASDLLGDFTLYHAVFAVLALATGIVLTTLAARGVVLRRQPTWLLRAAVLGVAGGGFLLLAAANASTWAHPAPALVASLGGA